MRRALFALTTLSLGVLAACTQYALVPAQQTVVRSVFTVQPGLAWNKLNEQGAAIQPVEIWTIDGVLLHTLAFYTGIEDGDPLHVLPSVEARTQLALPTFRRTMSESELAELVESTLTKLESSSVYETIALAPVEFGGRRGFRLHFRYVAKDEVRRDGLALGTIYAGKLFMVIYRGTSLYHFERYRPEVERIVASLKM